MRGAWRAARHPLARAVLGRIVRDEAAHGHFGWAFLDWALPHLGEAERALLAAAAAETIAQVRAGWAEIRARPAAEDSAVHALGWLQSDAYLALAARSLAREVMAPLGQRGLALRALGAEAAQGLA